ncbi:type II toxin-antitoxin system RelE/ParE family toxin [Archangium violaceum]|uniref:type II toxin-antitoxin system RelE/ParE family toxin n=1 Tax=Archangium violaceum TaxID=83451 RepID=UPI0005B96AF3|nr:type II toxin-antitoxin system RelE/ParE family toxin [Archangium violaceum]
MVWTERALKDLRAIGDYIAGDDPVAAERWVGLLIATAESAAATPFAGRVVPELRRDEVREVFRKTYRIVYRVREQTIEILTVFEGHRRFPGGLLAGDDEP